MHSYGSFSCLIDWLNEDSYQYRPERWPHEAARQLLGKHNDRFEDLVSYTHKRVIYPVNKEHCQGIAYLNPINRDSMK
jgi:hypothetical protein